MDFDEPKVYGDTSITDGLVILLKHMHMLGELADYWLEKTSDAQL